MLIPLPVTDLGRSLGLEEVKTPRICRQSAHEGGNVVSLTHRLHLPPPPPRRYSWYSFLLETELTRGPRCGRNQWKVPQWFLVRAETCCPYCKSVVVITHLSSLPTLACMFNSVVTGLAGTLSCGICKAQRLIKYEIQWSAIMPIVNLRLGYCKLR